VGVPILVNAIDKNTTERGFGFKSTSQLIERVPIMQMTAIRLNVGQSITSARIRVHPGDVAAVERERMVAAEGEPSAMEMSRLLGFISNSQYAPTETLVQRSARAVSASLRAIADQIQVFGVTGLKVLGAKVKLGEPLEVLATVGFRGRGRGDSEFVTIFVEVRRAKGSTALRYEMGVGLVPQPSPSAPWEVCSVSATSGVYAA